VQLDAVESCCTRTPGCTGKLLRQLPRQLANRIHFQISHALACAEAQGFDLAKSSVKQIIVAAEPLSPAKRQKLERSWGAEVSDQFGMTEGALISVQSPKRDGLHVWSDLFFCEVVDEVTGLPVPEGEVGTLAMTALYNNNVTPFLRWNSGDLVSIKSAGHGEGPWSIFPVMQHARRTVGFFKVRGVNINHNELEDLLFYNQSVQDFKAEVHASESGNDILRLLIEPRRDINENALRGEVDATVRKTFEVTPEIVFLERGTLGKEFEASIKAARFVDKRG